MNLADSIPVWMTDMAAVMKGRGIPCYIVGGWCRDVLAGLAPKDIDIAGPVWPDTFAQEFHEHYRVIPKALQFGTVEIHDEQGHAVEYTGFRREQYGDQGIHTPNSAAAVATVTEDSRRRDFTINAIYADAESGQVFDPCNGVGDIEKGIIRTCREPEQTLREDALRLMRMVRQAGELDFEIEPHTWQTACALAPLVRNISPERIRQELCSILLSDTRYPSKKYHRSPVYHGLELLAQSGLLEQILPELWQGNGMGQRADYHDYDVLQHCLHSCAAAPADITLRLAALLHDVGKPAVMTEQGNYLNHDRAGESICMDILNRLRFPRNLVRNVGELVRYHMYDIDGRTGIKKLKLFMVERGEATMEQLIELRRADVRGSRSVQNDPAERWVQVLGELRQEGIPWDQNQLALSGEDICSIIKECPSPKIGRIKKQLHRYAILHSHSNTKEKLTGQVSVIMRNEKSNGW